MTEELEGTLGGVYSQLNQDMQQNRLVRLVIQMKRAKQLPDWPEGLVEPVILTGLETLGREQDITRVQTALQFLQGMPPETLNYVKFSSLLGKAFYGLNLPDAVRTEEEVQKMQQEQQRQAALAQGAQMLAQQAGSAAGDAIGGVAQQAMSQQ